SSCSSINEIVSIILNIIFTLSVSAIQSVSTKDNVSSLDIDRQAIPQSAKLSFNHNAQYSVSLGFTVLILCTYKPKLELTNSKSFIYPASLAFANTHTAKNSLVEFPFGKM